MTNVNLTTRSASAVTGTNPLDMLNEAVESIVEGLNPTITDVDGVVRVNENPKVALGPKILADKIAGALHDQLHGRKTIQRNKDRSFKTDKDGKVLVTTTNGQHKYTVDALDRMTQAFQADPDCARPWTERSAAIYTEQTAFTEALTKMKAYFVSLYIEACAGTETEWTPYVDRQIAAFEAGGPALDVDAETKERRAKIKAEIEARIKAATKAA